jgi:hypothetical protein
MGIVYTKDSTTIKSLNYLKEIKMLEVEFVRGVRYTYLDVPAEVYDALIFAESIGSYFNKNIAKKYLFQKG